MSGAIAAGAIAGGAALGGAALSSHAAGEAADTQASAAERAAQLQYQASQNALDFQKQQYYQNQQNLAPWLQSGTGALSNLDYLLGIGSGGGTFGAPTTGAPVTSGGAPATGTSPTGTTLAGSGFGVGMPRPTPMTGATSNVRMSPFAGQSGGAIPIGSGTGPTLSAPGSPSTVSAPGTANPNPAGNPSLGGFGSLMQPYGQTFTAPTDITEQNDPGYQARLKLGTDAIQRSAAARGGVVTGGTAQALDQFGQDYASNEYNNVYNRALQGFDTNYNVYNQNQANQFNRLAALAGIGQTAANTLGTLGNATSGQISSNLLGTAANMGQQYNNAAAANASGYVGSANAYGGALSGIGNNLSNLYMMQQMGLLGGGGGVGYTPSGNELTDMGV